ncbi:protein of unknown function [Candidatus Nitrosotalea okcheonensis]|uniref:Uncharacterized protein n=1 Tax=Candidatus Nitrosotalea okcheonensis TaxID=1903276 RepID=A0A2H1FEH6_9ARCH|nr:protein of unknown function [Candidatus Nitrosotalea okcheonensis]
MPCYLCTKIQLSNKCQVSQAERRPPRDQKQGSGYAQACRGSNPLPGVPIFSLNSSRLIF